MANKYELQAARIETVLTAHKVPARVWQATVTPRFVRFDITTALGTRLNKVSSLAEELAFALGAQATAFVRHLFEIAATLVRAVYSQPLAWVLTLAMLAIVCAWTSVTASVWLPARRHLRLA